MRDEISRNSYRQAGNWDNRMQVVVVTKDGNRHVFNFINYLDSAHSHIVYDKNGNRVYTRNFAHNSAANYEHEYISGIAEWENASVVSEFPYNFEQRNDFVLDSLSKEQLYSLKQYLAELSSTIISKKTR